MLKTIITRFFPVLLAGLLGACGGGGAFVPQASDTTGGTSTSLPTLPDGATVEARIINNGQPANGKSAATLFIVVRDVAGVPLSGMPVNLAFSKGSLAVATTSSGLTDSNGSFTAEITSLAAEQVIITPIVGSRTQQSVAAFFTVASSTLPANVTLSVNQNSVPADGSTSIALTIIARDRSGTPIANVPVTLSSSSGSALFTAFSGVTGENGAFTTSVTNTVAETVQVIPFAGGIQGNTRALSFVASPTTGGGLPVASVTTEVQNNDQVANGTDAVTLVIFARDANGDPVSGASGSVILSGGSATVTPDTGTTDSSGRLIVTLTNKFVESFTATAAVDNVKDSSPPTISFVPVAAGASQLGGIELIISNDNQPANGTATVTATVVVRDKNNVPVTGEAITLSSVSGTAVIDQTSGVTSGNGTFTTTIRDTTAGTFDLTAWINRDPALNAKAAITFTTTGGGSGQPVSTVAISVTNNNQPASGQDAITLTIVAKDAAGAPIEGAPVTLFFTDKDTQFCNPSDTNCFVISAVPAEATGITNAGGSFSTTLTDTVAETFKVKTQVGSASQISGFITFEAAAAATPPSAVSLSVDKNNASADGTALVNITVVARDARGTPIAGVPVTLAVNNISPPDPLNLNPAGSALLNPASGTTGDNGAFFATITNTNPGDVVLSATAGNVAASTTETITFTQTGAVTPDSVVLSFSNNNAQANGTDAIALIVAVRNAFGQPVVAAPVSLSLISLSNPGNPPSALFSAATGASGETGADGTFKTSLTSVKAETLQVQATAGGIDSGTVDIVFTEATTVNPSSMQLITSNSQLLSEGKPEGVLISAILKTADNNPFPGAEVRFSANSGVIQAVQTTGSATAAGITNSAGTAQAVLNTVGNAVNRTITVTAISGDLKQTIQVTVDGTELNVTGPNTATLNANVDLTVFLKDSAGNGVAGQTLKVTSQLGNPLNGSPADTPITVKTDNNGNAVVTVNTIKVGASNSDLITVDMQPDVALSPDAAPLQTTYSFNISDDNFTVVSEPLNTKKEIPLDQNLTTACSDQRTPFCQKFKIHWDKNGAPQVNSEVSISATRGVVSASSINLVGFSGEGVFYIHSNDAGPTIITVTGINDDGSIGPSIQLQYEFIADRPNSITLQASPSTIGVNTTNSSAEQSEISAVVRDAQNNLVKNAQVNFTLTDVTGGRISPSSVLTDSFGRAGTVYTAGPFSSASDGVKITASVDGTSINAAVNLTVAQKGVFVSLGTGNTIFEPNETLYEYPYTIIVNDVNGGPVAGAQVVLSAIPLEYHKGYYRAEESKWVRITTISCLSEDRFWEINDTNPPQHANAINNGLLDAGEDINSNGRLEPGNLLTVNPGKVTTDENGLANFKIVYAQENAGWLSVRLSAKTTVAGSEDEDLIEFRLAGAASDYADLSISPPGNPSPFGYGGDVTYITDDINQNGIVDTQEDPPGPSTIDYFNNGKVDVFPQVVNSSCTDTK